MPAGVPKYDNIDLPAFVNLHPFNFSFRWNIEQTVAFQGGSAQQVVQIFFRISAGVQCIGGVFWVNVHC